MDIWVHVKTPELEDTYQFHLNRETTILDLTKKIKRDKGIGKTPLAARFNQKVVNPMTRLCELTPKNMSREKPIEMFIGTNIFMDGLPPVVPIGRSSSYPSSNHVPATFVEKEFGFKHSAAGCNGSEPDESLIWTQHNFEAEYYHVLEWNVEASLAYYVERVLKDVFKESELGNIYFRRESALFDAKLADIWLVIISGIPIGVVEVKRYTASDEYNPVDIGKFMGQLYDYLLHLKSYTGMQHVFGILTTYDKWRIFWLSETDEVAGSIECTPQQVPANDIARLLPSEIPWQERKIDFPETQTISQEFVRLEQSGDRVIHGSRIFDWNDPALPYALCALGQKMISSPMVPRLSFLEKEQSYIYMNKREWCWQKVTKTKKLIVQCELPKHLQNVILLADLGGGGDGRVWLASTETGCTCVVKFCRNSEILEQEALIWKEAWNMEVQIKELNGTKVLVMPWVKPCSEEEMNNNPDIKEAVKNAIQRLAEVGYEHDDLNWRHVGLYQTSRSINAILFDLARVCRVENKDKSILAMFKALKI